MNNTTLPPCAGAWTLTRIQWIQFVLLTFQSGPIFVPAWPITSPSVSVPDRSSTSVREKTRSCAGAGHEAAIHPMAKARMPVHRIFPATFTAMFVREISISWARVSHTLSAAEHGLCSRLFVRGNYRAGKQERSVRESSNSRPTSSGHRLGRQALRPGTIARGPICRLRSVRPACRCRE